MTRRLELAVLALIVAAYAVSLGRTASYGYVWDDRPEIESNASFDLPLVEGIKLTQTERAAPTLADLPELQFNYDSYRPLLFASYWADVHLWGRDAGALHRTNVVLGALAILMAYLLARRWLRSPVALVATAVFALHPVQIEAVAYISGRGDLLGALFALAAAYGALRFIDGGHRAWAAAAALAFVCSLASKESLIALPFAIPFLRTEGRRRWIVAAILLALAVVYLPVRGAIVSTTTRPPYVAGALGLPGVLLEYAKIFVLPFDLSIERQPHALYAWLGLIVLPLLVLGRKHPGVIWAAVLLAPSAIAVRSAGIVADRYAYAPLFGLAIAVSAIPWKKPVIAAVAVWGALLVVVGWRQVPVWRDVTTLYGHALDMAPDSASANYRVAVLLGEPDGVPLLERAIELDGSYTPALNNLGVHHLQTGEPARAVQLLQRAVAAQPAHFRSWLNLGLAQIATGDRDAGCKSIARALAINPRYDAARREQQQRCR